jgi:hypothetical protein
VKYGRNEAQGSSKLTLMGITVLVDQGPRVVSTPTNLAEEGRRAGRQAESEGLEDQIDNDPELFPRVER